MAAPPPLPPRSPQARERGDPSPPPPPPQREDDPFGGLQGDGPAAGPTGAGPMPPLAPLEPPWPAAGCAPSPLPPRPRTAAARPPGAPRADPPPLQGLDARIEILRAEGLRPSDPNGLADPFVSVLLSRVVADAEARRTFRRLWDRSGIPEAGGRRPGFAPPQAGERGRSPGREPPSPQLRQQQQQQQQEHGADAKAEDDDGSPSGYLLYSTPTMWRTLDPTWDDELVVRNVPGDCVVLFRLVDRDAYFAKNDWLGDAVLPCPLRDASSAPERLPGASDAEGPAAGPPRPAEFRLPVTWGPARTAEGRLAVRVEVLGPTGNPHLPTRRAGPIHWHRHKSKSAGVVSTGSLLGLIGGDPGYHTYAVDLHHTAEVFGNTRQPWSRAHRPAAQIFGEGPACEAVRLAVRAQHRFLFHNNAGSEQGVILQTRGFFDLIEWGRRKGKPRVFTYVVNDGQCFFGETGDTFGKDALSKHAVLAGGSPEVVYSGEFFVVQSQAAASPAAGAGGGHGGGGGAGCAAENILLGAAAKGCALALVGHVGETVFGSAGARGAAVPADAPPGAAVPEAPGPPSPHDPARPPPPPPPPPRSPSSPHVTNLPPPPSGSFPEGTPLPLLVLTNNSGTYAPSAAELPRLESIWRANFPGISVTALDRADERIAALRAAAGLPHH